MWYKENLYRQDTPVELLIVGWDMEFVLHSFDYKFPKALVYMSSLMLEESFFTVFVIKMII